MQNHKLIWQDFCSRHQVDNSMTPLFETSPDNVVLTKPIGKSQPRAVLRRSQAMESLVRQECAKLISDWETKQFIYDGLIYMMAIRDVDEVIPLYIGKAETLGKGNGNLSANIRGIARDTSKFARWGDNYAYHIGDLSAVVLPGHDPKHATQKYKAWAARLFHSFPTYTPLLKRQVYFWTKAWSSSETGAWFDFGPTRLTFLEYQLIGLASAAFGDSLLNREGHNRE